MTESEQLDVGLRLGGADDLGIELVEFAKAALLRARIAERRAVSRDLERRILLPAFGEIGAADAGGELGAQGDRFAAAVLERIHFLGDDVGGLADRARENMRLLNRRHFDAFEAVKPTHAVERRNHRRQAVGVFVQKALRAPDGLNRRHCRAAKACFACLAKASSAWLVLLLLEFL